MIIISGHKEKTVPNQSVWRSLKNSIIGVLIGVLIGGLFVGIFGLWAYAMEFAFAKEFDFDDLAIVQVIKYLVIGWSGMICWLSYGGRTCIQHFNLRLILTFKGYIPWNYARFLDYAAERIFLQKVGGGYIFIHRLLLEHFAQMEVES